MRRLHTAALAAFLFCSCVGIAHAYFVNCELSGMDGSISFNTVTGAHFVTNSSGTCGAGTSVQCCYQVVNDLFLSTDGGMSWHPVNHTMKQYLINCGKGFSNAFDNFPAGTGLYRLDAKIQDCSGVLIKDLGSLTHTF